MQSRKIVSEFGIEIGDEIAAGAGIGALEQMIVEPDLAGHGIGRRHPVQRRLHLAAIRARCRRLRRRIIGAAQLDHLAGIVLHHVAAGDEIGVAQPHFACPATRRKNFFGGFSMKSSRSMIDFAAEAQAPRAGGPILGMVERLEFFDRALRIVFDDELERPQHRHAARGGRVQNLADRMFEHRIIGDTIGFGDAETAHELADRRGGNAAPAQSRERRHARIIPAIDMIVADEIGEKALRQDRVGEIEAGEFILVRVRRHRQLVEEPVVERPVILEFQRADGMGDSLDRIRLAMGEIVARVDAPCRAGARMGGMEDAVEHRIAQIDIARRHVDLGAQHA